MQASTINGPLRVLLGGQAPDDPPLPLLRPDLRLYHGPRAGDGSPTYTLYDPLNRAFFKLGWAEAAVVEQMTRPNTLSGVMYHLARRTTLGLDDADVLSICQQMVAQGLTTSTQTREVEELLAAKASQRMHPLRWLVHHYITFKLPLLHPDRFLTRTWPYVRLLGGRPALTIYMLLSLLGLFLWLPRSEVYFQTFTYFFNWQGLLSYGLTLALVKAIHEFSHAYVAKGFGARVPVMGVIFIVLWPLAYSDVTDAWKLGDRRKRLLITTAGVAAELVIAGLALLGWGLTTPGTLNSVFFLVSSGSLISSLLINLNPAMRWDGYYMLMDLWRIDNLQTRAFEVTLWSLRRWLLGLDEPSPEDNLGPRRQLLMVAYSIYAWIYRFFLYLGIALVVYFNFTKFLGAMVFAVDVWWFIVMPVYSEIKRTIGMRGQLRINPKLLASTVVLTGIILWLALPLPRDFSVPAVIVSAKTQVVYAAFSGMIQEMNVRRGDDVRQGQMLVSLISRELQAELANQELEWEITQKEMEILALSEEGRAMMAQKAQEAEAIKAKMLRLRNRMAQNQLRAEFDGKACEWNENLRVGSFVGQDAVMGKIYQPGHMRAYGFVGEEMVSDIRPGDKADFFPGSGPFSVGGTVAKVSPVRKETINHVGLTSMAHGNLPVARDKRGALVMLDSYYLIEIDLRQSPPEMAFGQGGNVWLKSKPRSRLADGGRALYRLFLRETNY